MGGFGGSSAVRLVAGLAAVAGVLLALWGGRGIMDSFDNIVPVDIPGSTTLALTEGTQTIYYDMDDGASPPSSLLFERVRVTGPGGGNIPVDTAGGNETLSTPSRDLISLLKFEVPRDGDYTVTVQDVSLLPPGRLAVGPGFFESAWRFVAAVIGGAILALGGLITMLTSAASKGKAGPVPSRTQTGKSTGKWGRNKTDSGHWGGDDAADRDPDDMWGDSHDWSDEFDPEPEPPSAPGRPDGWGSGRRKADDLWRRPSNQDHDDGMPPPPSSF